MALTGQNPIFFYFFRFWGPLWGGNGLKTTYFAPAGSLRRESGIFPDIQKVQTLFSSILALSWVPRWPPKIHKKSLKSRVRNCTAFWINFRTDFYRFFLRISTPREGKNQAKTMKCCSFLHFSHFRLVFLSGLDFRPFWAPFWSGFGLLFLIFFASKTDQKINDFSHQFFKEFCLILGPKKAP